MSWTIYKKSFSKHCDYTTPAHAWEDIKSFIPDNKIIWSPFYCNGEQKNIFKNMGYDIIHQEKDFFTYTPEYDLIIDNPPFDKCNDIFIKLKKLNKPFILLMPTGKLSTKYFKDFMKDNDKIQIIIPKKRINFIKYVDGVIDKSIKPNGCNFDCYYYCFKMNLKNDITFIY